MSTHILAPLPEQKKPEVLQLIKSISKSKKEVSSHQKSASESFSPQKTPKPQHEKMNERERILY